MTGAEIDPNDPLGALRGSASTADDQFVDRLDARLRVQHAATRHPVRPPLWRRVAVLAPAMVVLLVVASVVFVARDQSPSAALVLTDAENVTVHLPDGTSVNDPADGFELIEGARLEIREGGMATIDDVTVDVAAVLVVRGGELVTDVVVTTTTPRAEDRDGPDDTAAGDVSPDGEDANDARDGDEPTPDPDPGVDGERRDEDSERDQDPPRPQPSVRPEPDDRPEPEPEPPTDPPAPVDPPAVEIGMRLRAVDDGVRISWFIRGADDSWTMAVVRREGEGAGEDASTVAALLAVDGVTLVADARRPSEGQVVDDTPPGDAAVRYRVLVVDSGGGIVASGPSQSLRR